MSCKSQDGKFKQQRKLDTTCFNDSYKQSYIIIVAMSCFVTLQKGGENFDPTGQAMHSLLLSLAYVYFVVVKFYKCVKEFVCSCSPSFWAAA
jgi:hypothetical protein